MLFQAVYGPLFRAFSRSVTPAGILIQDSLDEAGLETPRVAHIEVAWLIGVALFFLRYVIEWLIFDPLARRILDVRGNKTPKAAPNPILERKFMKQRRPTQAEFEEFARETNMSSKAVQSWYRHKRNELRPSLRKKVCEAAFRFVAYTFLTIFGAYILKDMPWVKDDQRYVWDHVFTGQPTEPEVKYFYFAQLGFYISLAISQCNDVKRKDFTEMIIHHVVTISLISFSYACGFMRVGTLVLLSHDLADVLLELAKIFNYLQWSVLSDTTFGIFAIFFIITRCFVYPVYVISLTIFDYWAVHGPVAMATVFQILLCTLLALHVFWSYTIVYMVHRVVIVGFVEKDARSESEQSSDSESESKKKK